MAQDTVFAIPGEQSQVQVSDGTKYLEVDGSGDVTFSPSAAPVLEVANYRGTFAHTGKERPPSCSIPITTFMPYNPVWRLLKQDQVREFRILWGRPSVKYAKKTTAALDGVITATTPVSKEGTLAFTGTDAMEVITKFISGDFGRNLVINVDNVDYVLTSFSGTVPSPVFNIRRVDNADVAAVTAEDVEYITLPAVQYDFEASITSFSGMSNPVDGVLNTTLELKLQNPLNDPTLVTAAGSLYL